MLVGLQEHSGSAWAARAPWECLLGCRSTLGVLGGLQGHSGSACWAAGAFWNLVGLQEHSGNACWAAGALWEWFVGCGSILRMLGGL